MVHCVGTVFADAQILRPGILAPSFPLRGRGCELFSRLSLARIPVLLFQRTRNSWMLKEVNAVISPMSSMAT